MGEDAHVAAASEHTAGDHGPDPAERFASGLRALRDAAGRPTYRQMAARTGQSAGSLAAAAKGRQLPSLPVALAYAEACDGDRAEWERRWRAADSELGAASARRRRRWRIAVTAVTAALASAVVVTLLVRELAAEPPPSDSAAHGTRFFAEGDVFNQRHPHPHLSADSAQMVDDLLRLGQVEVYTGTAGIPVYRAGSDTPVYDVTPRRHVGAWGPDPFEGVAFPWEASWKAAPKSAWTVVITSDGQSVECLHMEVREGRPSCEWGAVSDAHGASVSAKGVAAGSGLSRLAGLITREDWKSGHIDHALSFGTPDNNPGHVFPAVGSDGDAARGRWRQGQFIWLAPGYDVDADASLKPYERMIAKALQEYGAFDVKNAKTFGFRSEYGSRPPGGAGGYTPLTDIRFAKYLRVGTVAPGPPGVPAS